MSKSSASQEPKMALSPASAFVLYCLATPEERRDAVRQLLGEARVAQLFGIGIGGGSDDNAGTSRRRER